MPRNTLFKTFFSVLIAWFLTMGYALAGVVRQETGSLYGKVIDAKTKKPIEYASVVLLDIQKDSVLTGALTGGKGEFDIDNISYGAYRVKISFTGYTVKIQSINCAASAQDVGNILLEEDARTLNTVTVSAEKTNVKLAVDKKVFNVEKDISSRGGNGIDVMKNIPGVTVDADGNVNLRNNTPQIYVDGKPITISIDEIPADQIDRVEVITNPSAKYEAQSSGGILNIILKHNTRPGYNGIISLLLATNMQYNGNTLVNLHVKKINLMLAFNPTGVTNNTSYYNNRTNLNTETGLPASYYNQNLNRVNKRAFQFIRAGLDYYISARNTFSLTENASVGAFTNNINAAISSLDSSQNQISHGANYNFEGVKRNNTTTALNFKHTYPMEGKEYNLSLSYNHAGERSTFQDTVGTYTPAGSLLPGSLGIWKQGISSGTNSDMLTAQFDFSHPVKDSIKLEYGLRAYYKRTLTFSNVSDFIDSANIYQPDANLSSNYRIQELVNAAYITVSQQIRSFSWQLGVRYEESYFDGRLLDKNIHFSYRYPLSASEFYEPFFPSLYLSQKFGDKHELQLNFTRKINRPGFGQLNPNVEVIDQQNYERGNPGLKPEFSNQAELNYNLSITGLNWLSSAYGKFVQQPINGYSYDSSNILIITSINGKSSFAYGWENSFKVTAVKNFDLMLDGNVFYTSVQANPAPGVYVNNSGISWFAKAIITYKFPWDLTAQVNGSYEAPKIVPQGKTMPVYYFDLSVSKAFGNISLNFTVSDVLNSKRNGYVYSTPDFLQSITKRREVRSAKLSVVFKFGKNEPIKFKKQKKEKLNLNEDSGD